VTHRYHSRGKARVARADAQRFVRWALDSKAESFSQAARTLPNPVAGRDVYRHALSPRRFKLLSEVFQARRELRRLEAGTRRKLL